MVISQYKCHDPISPVLVSYDKTLLRSTWSFSNSHLNNLWDVCTHLNTNASLDPAAIWQLCAANKTTWNKASRTNLHTSPPHFLLRMHQNHYPPPAVWKFPFPGSVVEIMENIDQEISINYLPPLALCNMQQQRGFCTVTNYSCLLLHLGRSSFATGFGFSPKHIAESFRFPMPFPKPKIPSSPSQPTTTSWSHPALLLLLLLNNQQTAHELTSSSQMAL